MNETPQVPKRFVEDNIVKNMKVGEMGYIPLWGGIQLDTDRKLWIYAQATVSKKPVPNGISDGDKTAETILMLEPSRPALKIERLENGYKVYLYDYFDFLREKRFNCEKFTVCESETEQPCMCRGLIRRNLLKTGKLHADVEFVPVTDFDEPVKNLNDPNYINALTPESLTSMKDHELQIILVNSTEDENYLISKMILEEIRRRK